MYILSMAQLFYQMLDNVFVNYGEGIAFALCNAILASQIEEFL